VFGLNWTESDGVWIELDTTPMVFGLNWTESDGVWIELDTTPIVFGLNWTELCAVDGQNEGQLIITKPI
jgi:translation elongation factor EF-1beta